ATNLSAIQPGPRIPQRKTGAFRGSSTLSTQILSRITDLYELFFVVVFFAADFLAVVFLAVVFLAVVFFAVRFFAGPRARFSASRSAARCNVTDCGSSSLRRVALISPSLTYGPKRPSFTTTGLFVAGSSPSSRSGAELRAPRPRFGCLYSSRASSRVIEKICSSSVKDRESVPFFKYGP